MQEWIRRAVLFFTLFIVSAFAVHAQVTGGQFAFEYLRLSQSPHVSALGGINVANPDGDITLAVQNPALMRPGLHNELALDYDAYYAGISVANLAYGYYVPKLETSFLLGVQYLNYGSFDVTDNVGNTYGTIHALDYAVSLGASRAYGERWRYGIALKGAHSGLYDGSSSAVLADVGIVYYDTANLITVAATAKNMGVTVQKYIPGQPAEPLPFDLQLGFSKRFAHLPLRLMVTLHHLYEWDVRYNDPADIDNTSIFGTQDTTADTKAHVADKIFRHFIFAGELSLGKRITLTVAYNHLQRAELDIADKSGLAGFSFGAGIDLGKFQVHYARSYYHLAGAYNEFGLSMALGKLIGIGKKAEERMHWSDFYPDWGL